MYAGHNLPCFMMLQNPRHFAEQNSYDVIVLIRGFYVDYRVYSETDAMTRNNLGQQG